ncbi:MAG: GNAT family N-acetyltransferase [Eubacteriales bacterium]|nr:GNAT family N-acetyltransferase [Eubacteriales bacterium]
MEWQEGTSIISDDKKRLQIDRICDLLKTSYWAGERNRETIERSIEHSICFGVYQNGEQVGFARCVTDYATMFWLADVILDERVRGQGLGKALVDRILRHEQLQGLIGMLATRDAQGLYRRFGFDPIDARYFRKRVPPKPAEK